MKLIQFLQEKQDAKVAKKIMALENIAWPQNGEDENFPSVPDTYVTSFVFMEKDTAVCHVGVRKSILQHKGEIYSAYGLSEVVTNPHYQNKGLASQLNPKSSPVYNISAG